MRERLLSFDPRSAKAREPLAQFPGFDREDSSEPSGVVTSRRGGRDRSRPG
jgi:hypothetical protein